MQNFLFTTKDEHAQLKAIDFGLSDFIKPGEFCNFYFSFTLHITSSLCAATTV
jgi:hypothetical protein